MSGEMPNNPENYLLATAFIQATREFVGIRMLETGTQDNLLEKITDILPDPAAFDSREFLGEISSLLERHGLPIDDFLDFLLQKELLTDWDSDTSYQNP